MARINEQQIGPRIVQYTSLSISLRDDARKRIEKEIAEFISSGKKITEIKTGESAYREMSMSDLNGRSYNTTPDMTRKEPKKKERTVHINIEEVVWAMMAGEKHKVIAKRIGYKVTTMVKRGREEIEKRRNLKFKYCTSCYQLDEICKCGK